MHRLIFNLLAACALAINAAADSFVQSAAALCLAHPGERYIIYLRQGGATWTTPAVPDTGNWVFLVEKYQ